MRTLAATVAAALALAGAAQAAPWFTEAQALSQAKAHGVTATDGSHATPMTGFCHGYGPTRGTLLHPRYQRFNCTFVFKTSATSTAWYDVTMTSTLRIRVLSVY